MTKLLGTIALVFLSLIKSYAIGETIGNVGKTDLSDWVGFDKIKNGEGFLSDQTVAFFEYADGSRHHHGFRVLREDVADWSSYTGLSIDLYLKSDQNIKLDVSFSVPAQDKEHLVAESHAIVQISGKGWHQLYLPWDQFDINRGQLLGTLQAVKKLTLSADFGGRSNEVRVKNIQVTKGRVVALQTDIHSKAAPAGEQVSYDIVVTNNSRLSQAVELTWDLIGWESMSAAVTPNRLTLLAGETKKCQVTVDIPAHLPQGNREKQRLIALPNGDGSAAVSLELITVTQMDAPYILHTAERWAEVADKVEHYDWAKKELAKYEKQAQDWQVPTVATELSNDNADKGQHLFRTQEEYGLMAAGIAYRLTGKMEYAEKVALFLRRLSNPDNGYPTTFRGCHQSFVQEGHFFQHIAMAYDMVADSGLFTEQDQAQIETTFRLYIETVQLGYRVGAINNWLLSEITGALYCALVIQDWYLAEDILYSSSGVYNQFAQGVMNDGWWYECSVGYNVWCSSEFSQIALALDPWGVDFKNMKLPIGTTPFYNLMPGYKSLGKYGINFDKQGPVTKNSVGIKDMWDALPDFVDYRGIMFAVNDAAETQVSGQPYELAYYMYRDPEYAAIIRRGEGRDLLYGVPELPDLPSGLIKKSAYADNIGIVNLRSQNPNRPQSEQIQASLHYGTHGGYHGHFDRTNFLGMMRYGRSFYNPEMVWYGYASHMYKFYVQSSMSKNMVVVDQKMQEATAGIRTMFYEGEMFQSTAVETTARWSNPPFGGMQYDYLGGITLAEKTWREGRTFEIPYDAPAYGELTDFTEPVFQRRWMVVTDDYVVLADYIKSDEAHTYDWLFQMKGLKELTADQKKTLRHDEQMTTDARKDAQFITDCDWYETEGTVKTTYEMCWGEGCDNSGTRTLYNEDGVLKIEVYNAWPKQAEVMIATTPEDHGVKKQLWYKVEGDGEELVNDSTGAWVLGSKDLNLNIKGTKQLILKTKVGGKSKPTVFWGDAKLILADGGEVALSSLPITYENVLQPDEVGKDYYGGPIKIQGKTCLTSLPAMPEMVERWAVITIDLKEVAASQFQARIGSDYPLGDESARRKTMAVRSSGKEAVYLSVIEPFESKAVVKTVSATDDETLLVEFVDGRKHEVKIVGLKGAPEEARVQIKEFSKGNLIREEVSKP